MEKWFLLAVLTGCLAMVGYAGYKWGYRVGRRDQLDEEIHYLKTQVVKLAGDIWADWRGEGE